MRLRFFFFLCLCGLLELWLAKDADDLDLCVDTGVDGRDLLLPGIKLLIDSLYAEEEAIRDELLEECSLVSLAFGGVTCK